MNRMRLIKIAVVLVCVAGLSSFFEGRMVFSEDLPERVKKPVDESITIRQKTQKAEDRWAGELAQFKAEYEKLERENDRLNVEKSRLKKAVVARRVSVVALEHEIAEIARISDELIPFLEQTYDRLALLVKEDVPFLPDERRKRLETLRRTLDDAMVPAGEKFRKVMEAVSIEAEYGNTVEVYQEEIPIDDGKIQVNVFRLGRISLFFQTLDGKTTGYFDPTLFAWKKFPPEYNRQIMMAMEMGAKQRPVDLLVLPLGRLVAK